MVDRGPAQGVYKPHQYGGVILPFTILRRLPTAGTGGMLRIETTIHDEFPDEYEELFARWVAADVAAEHPRGVLTADCGICRSIATSQGVNLIPPDAA